MQVGLDAVVDDELQLSQRPLVLGEQHPHERVDLLLQALLAYDAVP